MKHRFSHTSLYQFVRTSLGATMILTLSAAAFTTEAQDRQLSDEQVAKIEAQVEQTQARLNVTDEQANLLSPLLVDNFEKRATILQSYGIAEGTAPNLSVRQKLNLRKEMQAQTEATTSQVAEILTDEQMTEFEKIQEDAREAFKARIQSGSS